MYSLVYRPRSIHLVFNLKRGLSTFKHKARSVMFKLRRPRLRVHTRSTRAVCSPVRQCVRTVPLWQDRFMDLIRSREHALFVGLLAFVAYREACESLTSNTCVVSCVAHVCACIRTYTCASPVISYALTTHLGLTCSRSRNLLFSRHPERFQVLY